MNSLSKNANDITCDPILELEFQYSSKMQFFNFAVSFIGSLYASYVLLNPNSDLLEKEFKVIMSVTAIIFWLFFLLSVIHIVFDRVAKNKLLLLDKNFLYVINVYMAQRFVKIPLNEVCNVVLLGQDNNVSKGQSVIRIYVQGKMFPFQFTEKNFKDIDGINLLYRCIFKIIEEK